ncbi:MAG: DUF2024 family protein [Candidatus Thiodiazotropha sp.]
MQLEIYNTYARAPDGGLMHFDVLVRAGAGQAIAREKAIQWLHSLGLAVDLIRLDSCDFCHAEEATPEYHRQVSHQGYAILQLEGCPSPIY